MRGFTILELVIVLGISAILASAGFSYSFKQKKTQALRSSTKSIVALLRDVRSRSLGQEGGESWGVRFSNLSSGDDEYEVFTGELYNSGSVIQKYKLGSTGVEFSSPSEGQIIDIVFDSITGRSSPSLIILSIPTDAITGRISISSLGQINGIVSE
jgi:prepilin-type N-terminal cleavage/methylation domain-containing protein